MRYWPFHYAMKCKRNSNAGLPFLYDNLGDDLLIVVIAFAVSSDAPLLLALAVGLLHISFWIIYEVGYFENDVVSERHESDGKTPPNFSRFKLVFSEKAAWCWASFFGVAGVSTAMIVADSYFLQSGAVGLFVALVLWGCLLAMTRAVFSAYNHVDKMSRIYLYLPMQFLKYAFPAIFFPLSPGGAALIFAQMVRRWLPYTIYRYSRKLPGQLPARLLRLIVFVSLWLLLLPSNFEKEHILFGAVAITFLTLRSMTQFRQLLRNSRNVRQDNWQSE